jgi:uncharacterized protein (DUF58 family)
MNNRSLTIGLIILCLLLAALIARNGDIAWMMLPFLAYLGAGLLQAPVKEKVRLNGKRSLELSYRSGSAWVDVSLGIQNPTTQTVYLSFAETLQAGMKITQGQLGRPVALSAGETVGLDYSFTATRGIYAWEHLHCVVSDPLGLVEMEMALPARAQVQIRPRIRKFKAIPFRPHGTLHSPGSIPARTGGNGTDFYGVREYHPGDPLRRLDWRMTARHPRKWFTREFEQEEIAEIGLIVDARHRTDFRSGESSLFEAGIDATASLAEMFLHQGQRVSLLVFGEYLLNAFPGYGKRQLQRILTCLSKARVGTGNHAADSLDFIPLTMFSPRALLIIISSVGAYDTSVYLRLRAAGYQVLLISPDPLRLAYPVLPQEHTQNLAVRAARLERQARLNALAQLRVAVINWPVDQALFPLVRNALSRSRGQHE